MIVVVLEGNSFMHVEAAALAVNLTRLQLSECRAECSHDCLCVTSLVWLQLVVFLI